ncbi:hypothetical protein GCM10022221_20710 [Actinocorallia aurea]
MPKPSRRSNPGRSLDPVAITTDLVTGRHLARCVRCTDTASSDLYGWVATWADDHTCDPEMVALLAVLDRRAA